MMTFSHEPMHEPTPLQVEVVLEFIEAAKLGHPQHELRRENWDHLTHNEARHRRRKTYDKTYNKTDKAKASARRYVDKQKADPVKYEEYKQRRRETCRRSRAKRKAILEK